MGAYRRYVLTARPRRREVPVEFRVQRLIYAIAAGVTLLLGLTGALVLGT